MNNAQWVVEELKKAKEQLKTVEDSVNLITQRNMQQTSGGVYFVCLPKKWADKTKIKKGDKVTLVWNKDDTITVVT